MDEKTLLLLKDEYLKLQDQYEDYDRRAIQIKSWLAAGVLASFAVSMDSEMEFRGFLYFAIICIATSLWYLEAKWKLFQYGVSDRIRVIEATFRGDPDLLVDDVAPFQIYNWWFRSYAKDEPIYPYEKAFRPSPYWQRLLKCAFQTFVHIPYSVVVALAIIFWAYAE